MGKEFDENKFAVLGSAKAEGTDIKVEFYEYDGNKGFRFMREGRSGKEYKITNIPAQAACAVGRALQSLSRSMLPTKTVV